MHRRVAHWIDDAVGALSRVMNAVSPPHPNTLDQLSVYEGREPGELFPEPKLPDEVTFDKRWNALGLVCEDICFESRHRPLAPDFRQRHADEYQANHYVYARWLRHVGGPRRPTFLYVHGWMQFEPLVEEFTLLPLLAKRLDMNVIHIQLPYHGRRKPGGQLWHGEYLWTADMVRTIEALRQSIADVRSLLSWLEAQAYGPVGVLGISLGGIVTLLTTCVEPRVWCSIPCVAHLDVGGVIEEASLLTEIRSDMERMGWGPAELDGWIRRLGLRDLRPAIDHDRILMVGGEHDRFLQSHRVRDLWEDWGRPEIDWFPGGHLGVFRYLCGDLRAARKFLDGLRGPQPIVEDTPVAPSGAPAPA